MDELELLTGPDEALLALQDDHPDYADGEPATAGDESLEPAGPFPWEV